MSDPDDSDLTRRRRDRRLVTILIVTLLGTATCFRLMRLSSVPGISGDEGWWGVQAHAWVSNRPYEAHTTSGNPTDLFFLIPVALVQKLAPPSFLLLRTVPTLVNLLAIPVGFLFVRRLYGNATAWIHAVGIAVLPTAIAHSRICQDPSAIDLLDQPRDLSVAARPRESEALLVVRWRRACHFRGRALDAPDQCFRGRVPAPAHVFRQSTVWRRPHGPDEPLHSPR